MLDDVPGLAQHCIDSSVLAIELLQSCTEHLNYINSIECTTDFMYKLTKIPIVFSHTWIFDPCLSPQPTVHMFMTTEEPLKAQPFQPVNPHCNLQNIC